MKKVFILFLFLLSVGITYSQAPQLNYTGDKQNVSGDLQKNADSKFATLLSNDGYLAQLPSLLSLINENQEKYSTTRSFNQEIVAHLINNGIGVNDEIHTNLRNYFGSTNPAVISASEAYLLENL